MINYLKTKRRLHSKIVTDALLTSCERVVSLIRLLQGPLGRLLVLLDERDRQRIDSMFEGRFDTIIQPTDRWVPKLGAEDTIPGEINITEETTT